MYARVTRFEFRRDRIDDAMRASEQHIEPGLRQEPGFRGYYVLTNRETGEGMVVTLWDSQADEEASRSQVGQRFGQLGDTLAGPPQPSMIFEVSREQPAP